MVKTQGLIISVAVVLIMGVRPFMAIGQTNILNDKITLSLQEKSVEEALELISQETGYDLNYTYSFVDRKITKHYRNISLRDVIRNVWGGGLIELRVKGKSIDLIPTQKSKHLQKADKGNLKGLITDKNGQPLSGTTIQLLGTGFGGITDRTGRFTIKDIPNGIYTVSISSIGFEKYQKNIQIEGSTIALSVSLRESVSELEEVVVSAKTASEVLKRSAKAVDVIETREAKSQTLDLGEVLSRTQGVNVQRGGGLGSNAQLSLNGLTNDQIRFFVDGVPLRSMGYIFGIANIPVNLIDRVEVYKGVVPVRFGADALGGAVNIVSTESFQGSGGNVSYQFGSFNTHRLAFNGYHQPVDGNYFVKASGFHDYTKNNYKIDVEVPDARGKLTEKTVRRFHDDYLARGINVEIGLRNQSWADVLMVRGFTSDGERDLQHNFIMSIPYGEITTGFSTIGGLLKWKKNFANKLSIENIAGFSESRTELLDTATFVYTWEGEQSVDLDGEIVVRDTLGERGTPADIRFEDRTYYNRLNLDFKAGDYHQIRLSSSPTYDKRSGRNFLITNPDIIDRLTLKNEIITFTNGLEYEYKRSDKLNIISFLKSYTQYLNTQEIEIGNDLSDASRSTNEIGWGANLKYKLNEKLELKTSYEWATRLPNLQEVFGDGIFISDNLDIKPERSHNVNLSANLKTTFLNKSSFGLGVNGFLREVSNLIVLIGADEIFKYQNVTDAASRGVELNMSWTSFDGNLRIVANSTYFDFVNTSDSGIFGAFKGDRIPNRPYLFFNSAFKYRLGNIFSGQNNLVIFGGTRYVHEFFRSWESAGRRDSKQVIPSQFTQNIGITHNRFLKDKKLAFTGEIQNLSNAKVFDLFGVQRPGRAFYLKTIFTF